MFGTLQRKVVVTYEESNLDPRNRQTFTGLKGHQFDRHMEHHIRTSESIFPTSPNAEEKRTAVPRATSPYGYDTGTCENIVYESVTEVITVPHLRTYCRYRITYVTQTMMTRLRTSHNCD